MALICQRGVYVNAIGEYIWNATANIDGFTFGGISCATMGITCHNTGYVAIASQFIGYIDAALIYGLGVGTSPGIHHQTDIVPR